MSTHNGSAFDTLMAAADPAMLVITTAAGGTRAGCLVGFHAQSSISTEPYCLWLSKANHTYRVAHEATHFAAHFLTADDFGVAEHFGTLTGESTDKFADLDVTIDDTGVPLLGACPNRMVLQRIALLDDGGDHVCLTTKVLSAESAGWFPPFRVSDAEGIVPGHGSEERAVQP